MLAANMCLMVIGAGGKAADQFDFPPGPKPTGYPVVDIEGGPGDPKMSLLVINKDRYLVWVDASLCKVVIDLQMPVVQGAAVGKPVAIGPDGQVVDLGRLKRS